MMTRNYDNIPITFPNFLKEQGVYEEYIANMYEQDINLSLPMVIERQLRVRRASSLVLSAFPVYESPEGEDFWNTIHALWVEYLFTYDEEL